MSEVPRCAQCPYPEIAARGDDACEAECSWDGSAHAREHLPGLLGAAANLKARFVDLRQRVKSGGCTLAGPGRGDCENSVGLPGESIPGQHDGPDDTVDAHGKPNGWCWFCWLAHQVERLKAEKSDFEDTMERVDKIAIQREVKTCARKARVTELEAELNVARGSLQLERNRVANLLKTMDIDAGQVGHLAASVEIAETALAESQARVKQLEALDGVARGWRDAKRARVWALGRTDAGFPSVDKAEAEFWKIAEEL